jgi:hypothetical protein
MFLFFPCSEIECRRHALDASECTLHAFRWITLDHWSWHASASRSNDFSRHSWHCQARAQGPTFFSHGRTTADRDSNLNISITRNKSDLILNSSRWLRVVWIVRQWVQWLFDFKWYNMASSGFRLQHGFFCSQQNFTLSKSSRISVYAYSIATSVEYTSGIRKEQFDLLNHSSETNHRWRTIYR